MTTVLMSCRAVETKAIKVTGARPASLLLVLYKHSCSAWWAMYNAHAAESALMMSAGDDQHCRLVSKFDMGCGPAQQEQHWGAPN